MTSFASHLAEAREALTSERLRFLRLIMFADEVEWDQAVTLVNSVANALSTAPWASVPAEVVDAIEWSGDGAESPSDAATDSPASWRMGVPADPQSDDPVGVRWRQLLPSRMAIAAAVSWMADNEGKAWASAVAAELTAERMTTSFEGRRRFLLRESPFQVGESQSQFGYPWFRFRLLDEQIYRDLSPVARSTPSGAETGSSAVAPDELTGKTGATAHTPVRDSA